MKKNDLKTGMMVECRNGNVYTVMLGTGVGCDNVLVRGNGWNSLDSYDNDLKCNTLGVSRNEEYDIMKVYKPTKEAQIGHKEDCDLIWTRREKFFKEDLKSGMTVVTREGKAYTVCLQTGVGYPYQDILLCDDGTWRTLAAYKNGLMWSDYHTSAFDIMKVYDVYTAENMHLVYERDK